MKHKSIFNVKSIIFYFFLGLYLAWSPTAFAQWAGGSGTSANPYQINNVGQLTTLQTTVNGGTSYSGLYFKLTANINLAGNAWTPIGTSSMSFKGNFDGDNHTISGLYINTSANDVGLFGYATGSSISNLGVITAPGGVNGGNNVGILLGSQNGGTISNCYVTGAVTGNDVTGGMVGNQPSGNPTITQCFAIADVTGGSGNNGTGGIVGVLRGSMSNSYAWGEVIGTGSVGGLCGTISTNGVANSCYAVGSSNSTSYAKVGGLAGNITQTSSRLKNSVALNNMISSNYSTTAGRIAGAKVYDNAGITDNNYATSDMKVFINATPKIITSDINGLDGGTQSLASLKNQTFYSNTVSWSINNINDNSKAWNIWEGINLPYLQKQSSPVNNIYTLGTVLQGNFRSDVAMDSISVYIKTGKTYSRLAKANVNNSNHTWTCSNSALAINGTLYVITYETGKSWPSYPVNYNICNLPLTFDVVNGNTYTSALNLQTCITNLQNTTINDIQFSKAGGTAFDANIIPSPTTYSVNGVQTIYARATNKFGCQSVIKSFQVKQITTLLFKEDFGSGDGCSTKPLESGTTAYTFGGDLKTNGRYSICSQLSSYYNDYFYYGAASYDHTDPGKGHSLIVNADFEPGKFYSLKINNLCPGTHLFFSAWIFNLVNPNAYMTAQFMDQGTTFNDPDLRFVLTDGVTNAFLAEYNTGSIPKVTDPATNWRPYGFDFITASSSSVILTI